MKNILEYKGYHAKIEVDLEANILYGKIEGIRDLVNFEAENFETLVDEFHMAVDDYLEFCEQIGKLPEKEYKGTFNIRIQPSLHRELALLALKNDESLNQTVEKALQSYVHSINQPQIMLSQMIQVSAQELPLQKYANANKMPVTPNYNLTTKGVKMVYSS